MLVFPGNIGAWAKISTPRKVSRNLGVFIKETVKLLPEHKRISHNTISRLKTPHRDKLRRVRLKYGK